MVDFLFSKLGQASPHFVCLLGGLFRYSLKQTLYLIFPQLFYADSTSHSSTIWFVDLSELVLSRVNTNRVGWVNFGVNNLLLVTTTLEHVTGKHGTIQLRRQFLFDGSEDEIAAVSVCKVSQRHAELLFDLCVKIVSKDVKFAANYRYGHQRKIHFLGIFVSGPLFAQS